MKKKVTKSLSLFFVFVLAFTSVFSFVPTTLVNADAVYAEDLFISEYIEGSSNNKAIEIFNGTGSDVDLSQYSIELYSNKNLTPQYTLFMEGTLSNGDVYVIVHAQASSELKDLADITHSVVNFNGDDSLVLKKGEVVVDSFGKIGEGIKWGGVTENNTLVRKSSVTSGDNNPEDDFEPSLEWDVYPIDTFEHLGTHTMDGFDDGRSGVDPDDPPEKVSNVTAIPAPGEVDEGTEIILTTSTEEATIFYTLDGSVPTIDSEVFDEPIVINEATTIKAFATKEGFDDSDIAEFTYTIKAPATVITIAEARALGTGNDAIIQGVVTGIIGNNAFIQDDTAGIYLYSGSNNRAEFVVGNEIKVEGRTDEYNNLYQINPINSVELISENNELPLPVETTIGEINEELEGQLVRIENLTLTDVPADKDSNYSLIASDGTNSIELRIDKYIEPKILSSNFEVGDKVIVTAPVGQFRSNYQLMIRTIDDIVEGANYATDLFISEYIEGSSYNKAIEIYNGTGRTVDLSGYRVELYANGNSTAGNSLDLSGTLAHNEVYVIANSSAAQEILDRADTKSAVTNFNGDDAIVLKYNDEIIDVFGQVGFDPGTAWGPNNETLDHTLVRKSSITTGDTNPDDEFDPTLEWDIYPQNTFIYLGSHTMGDGSEDPDTTPPTITHTPVTEGNINEDLIISATVTDDRGVKSVELYYRAKGEENYNAVEMTKKEDIYQYTISKTALTVEGIEYYIEASDGTNTATVPEDISVPYEVVISDADILPPEVINLTPASGASTGYDLRPTISAEYSDESGINTDSIKLYLDNVDVTADATITETKITYTPDFDLAEGYHVVRIEVSDNAIIPQTAVVEWNFYVGAREYKLYFGQLHSHTAENSDGSGTLAEAYRYARDVAKLDFFAVTDHSNSFDTAPKDDKYGTYNLGDYNKDNPKWQNGQRAAAEARTENFISIYGFEMTWSGGPGHINTFATEGFVSRNNTELNNKTNDLGLRTYYQLLKDTPNSISQFNHPGKTFGTFSEFAYLDPIIDARISLIEVGNGEGAVGSGGYFRSYEEYTKALDKGWHLAPTNNQDNHKGKWGNANTARTVIYTDDLSVEGLYDALRDMRVYATEDNNLEIIYTLNDEILGTIIDDVPEQAEFSVSITDPDSSDKIRSVSIVSNGGKIVLSETYGTQNAYFEETIVNPAPGYYYVKVVQEDGDIAVTAPIWLGSAPKVGINNVEHNKMMPVTDESLKITTSLFNNETEAVTIKSINYEIKNGSNIGYFEPNEAIAGSGGMYTHELDYTFTQPGIFTVVVTAVISQNGNDVTYSKELEVNVRDSEKLIYIGIDASHNNEYVSGNYKASMGNFGQLAAQYDVRTVELETSEELINALQNPKYKMMVFTVPSRRDGSTGRIPFKSYSQAEIDAIADFAKSGKTVIITGWGDYYESYSNLKNDPSFTADEHMAAQQNKLLSAIGAKLRLADDEAKDDVNNEGQPQRLYLTDHNNYMDPFTEGVVEEQVFSQYGGSTVYAVDSEGNPVNVLPSNISPIISGHATTYSADDDGDGNPVPPKYNDRVLIMANETVTHEDGTESTVIVSGGAFMSNFEIQVEIENAGTLPYSNYNILENIIISLRNEMTIEDVHKLPIGTQVSIEGIATTDVYDGSDNNKGFFDCIYIQDSTGGINLFPVSSGVKAGQRIRVLGTVGEYQGEKQIQVEKVTVIDSEIRPVTPKEVTPQEAMSPENTGSLVKFRGNVTEIKKDDNGVVGQLMVSGARVYINGYITKNISLADIEIGDEVEVTGISSIGENMSSDTEFLPRIRVRDRAEIVKIEKADYPVKVDMVKTSDINGNLGTEFELGNMVLVNAVITNRSSEDINGTLIVKLVDSEDRTYAIGFMNDVELSVGGLRTLSMGFNINGVSKGKHTAKVYVWNNFTDKTPLSEIGTVEFTVK